MSNIRCLRIKCVLGYSIPADPIPEESLPHLWEKFYKVDKARTKRIWRKRSRFIYCKGNYGFNEPAIWCNQLYQRRRVLD